MEDNLYLAVLGVRSGHLRLINGKADVDMRDKARAMAERGPTDRLDTLVAELSTASSASSRSGWRGSPSRS